MLILAAPKAAQKWLDPITSLQFAVKQCFLYLQDRCKAARVFTDASKTKSAVACAALRKHLSITEAANKDTTAFTAEAPGL